MRVTPVEGVCLESSGLSIADLIDAVALYSGLFTSELAQVRAGRCQLRRRQRADGASSVRLQSAGRAGGLASRAGPAGRRGRRRAAEPSPSVGRVELKHADA